MNSPRPARIGRAHVRYRGWSVVQKDGGDEPDPNDQTVRSDTLLLTVPNQLGVDYNAHVIEAIVKHVAPELSLR
jgi:hypothetical protein